MRRVCSSVLQSGFRLSSVVRGRGVSGGAVVAPLVGGSGASAVGRWLVVLLLALVGGFAFVAPGSAWATTGHSFVGQFGEAGTGDGQFSSSRQNGPVGLGVMSSTGEVFTADDGQGVSDSESRVQRFDATGEFQSKFALDPTFLGGVSGIGVGGGAVYVATGANGGDPAVVKYSLAGVRQYVLDVGSSVVSINQNAQVAVDPVDGTVYVTVTNEYGTAAVASFNPATGAFISSFDGSDSSPDGGFWCPSGLAVDGSHRVYVLDPCKDPDFDFVANPRVDRYSPAGAWEATVDDGSRGTPSAVAADPVSDEVYVSHTGLVGVQITHFTAGGGAPIYTFDASKVGGVRAMAANGEGTVYTSDATDPVVERFTRFEGPTVVTGGAPEETVEARSAVVEGTIDPEGVDSKYHFEYGLDQRYGSRTVGFVGVGSGSDPVAAAAPISGLKPNTTYHFRIVGSNDSGSIVGADQSFTTATAAADIGASFASAITPRSARINGAVNLNNTASIPDLAPFAETYFVYGTTAAYGSRTASRIYNPPVGGDYMRVGEPLSGLLPATKYYFRVVADNGVGGAQFGAPQTFVTSPAAGGGATEVTSRRATLTGTIDPRGQETTYRFNYGPTSAYGATTPEVGAGAGNGEQVVSQEVSGLSPDTTYHVQVVATSADGSVVRSGADGLFRTAPAPTAEASVLTGASTDAMTLAGKVNTFGQTGSYHFDVWSLDSSYRSATAERPVAGNASAERVSAAVGGLPVGETFVVQLTVASNDSIGVSDLVTFDTAEVPRVFPPPPATSAYGCGSPRLNAYGGRPKPGDTITISGQDLGVGGSVVLGDRSLDPTDWSASGLKVAVPEDASGTLALTVNCGHRSNTIAVQIASKSSRKFAVGSLSAKARKKASRSGLLPLRVFASSTGRVTLIAKATLGKKATQVGRVSKRVKAGKMTQVNVSLNSRARKRLRSGKKLHVTIEVRSPGASTRTTSILLPGVTS